MLWAWGARRPCGRQLSVVRDQIGCSENVPFARLDEAVYGIAWLRFEDGGHRKVLISQIPLMSFCAYEPPLRNRADWSKGLEIRSLGELASRCSEFL